MGAPLEPVQCGWTILARKTGKVKVFFLEISGF